jgi:hypothetical protein
MLRISLLTLSLLVMLTGPLASVAHAQKGGDPGSAGPIGGDPASAGVSPTSNNNGGEGLKNPLNNIDSLPDFLNAILHAVVQIGSIILVLALVYTGFLFVAAQGNQEKISAARSALMWTVIGGLILLGAEAIGLVIQATGKTL